MSADIKPWVVITDANVDGGCDIGIIVKIDEERDRYDWIPLPQKQALPGATKVGQEATNDFTSEVAPQPAEKRGRTKYHIGAPRNDSLSKLQQQVDEHGVSLRMSMLKGIQAMPLADLEELSKAPRATRSRDIASSVHVMKEQWRWIKNFALRAGAGVDAYLDKSAVAAYARMAAKTHGVNEKRVVRAIRAYLMAGLDMRGLLPARGNCGGPGSERTPRDAVDEDGQSQVGRRNIATRRGVHGQVAIRATAEVRQKLRLGYKKFKKKRVSVEQAYAMTLGEYWAEKVEIVRGRRKATLLPTNELPTIAQFRRHGPGKDPKRSAVRINVGEQDWQKKHRPLQGSERDGLRAAGQCAEIDATSDDQKLVMAVDRTVAMPSSWNTKVRENYTGYIASVYSGFESPSTLTSLMAIGLAADDKVEFCARYGVTIEPEDWMPVNFRKIRADNGELKSEEGIQSMTAADVSAEFVKAYAGERKGGIESAHFQLQVGATHQLAGSTMGQIRKRGERDPEKDRCLTHSEYMYHVIRWILAYNNVQRVPHLLTLEMRKDKVVPTRAEILRWMIKNHYVVTDPPNQEKLRSVCYPRIAGTLQRGGIQLFDPSSKNKRYIPGLEYKSAALLPLQESSSGRALKVDVSVHINPSDISKVWLQHNGLIQVDLHTHDPRLASLSLREWLQIADEDRLSEFLAKPVRLTVMSNDGLERFNSEKQAKAAKKADEVVAAATGGKRRKGPSKKEAAQLEAEAALNRVMNLPLPQGSGGGSKWFDLTSEDLDADEPDWVQRGRNSAAQ